MGPFLAFFPGNSTHKFFRGFWVGGKKLMLKQLCAFSKVPEGHHPRGTTLREALRGNLPLRALCVGLSEGSPGSL